MGWGGWGKTSWTSGKSKGAWGPANGWGAAGGKKGFGTKGVQKNSFKKASNSTVSSVPSNFAINSNQKYTGTVEAYWKLKGYGFIALDKKGVVPDDKVFVYWESLQSEDRFPMLTKGLKVQFTIAKENKKGKTSIRASDVTLPGGGSITLQDEDDTKKTFVGGQHLRYTGTLKFYIPARGYGYITIDDGYTYDEEAVPKEIRAEKAELNAGGANPGYMKELQVEFGIWKTRKSAYKAYNVTAPGGAPLPVDE